MSRPPRSRTGNSGSRRATTMDFVITSAARPVTMTAPSNRNRLRLPGPPWRDPLSPFLALLASDAQVARGKTWRRPFPIG